MPSRTRRPDKPRPLKIRPSGSAASGLLRPPGQPKRTDTDGPRTAIETVRIADGVGALASDARHAVVLATPTRADVRRMERPLIEGLEAAGYRQPSVEVRLHQYSGLRATMERARGGQPRRNETITIDLADGFSQAPPLALRGLAAGLGIRLRPKRPKPDDMAQMLAKFYDEWLRSGDARILHGQLRRARARKQGRGPMGEHYDLTPLFEHLVDNYFGGTLDPVQLTWSSRIGYSVFGHHDPDLDTIVINRCLDHPDIPEAVAAYVLYHEMLHHALGVTEGPSGCRRVHPPAFRRREERFPSNTLCDAYLSAMCTRRRAIAEARAPAKLKPLWKLDW